MQWKAIEHRRGRGYLIDAYYFDAQIVRSSCKY